MANEWRGDAQGVAQAGTLTVAGVPAAGNKIRVTVNRKFVEYTFVTADTTDLMAAGLASLLQASEFTEFKEVAWAYPGSGSVVSWESAEPGRPVTLAASATGGGATLTNAQTVASTGPNHADEAKNWSAGTLPADGEDIVVSGGSPILYGIDTAFAHDFATVEISGDTPIGLPFRNSEYVEYRPRYAVFGATVGCPVRVESTASRLNLSLYGGDVLDVQGTGTRDQDADGVPALNFITRNGTSTVANVSGDDTDAGYCCELGQSGTLATARVVGGAVFKIGEGGSVTATDQDGGTVEDWGDVTTANQTDGNYVKRAGTLATHVCDGGNAAYRHTGTVGTVTFRGQPDARQVANLDCTTDPRALAFTNCTFTGGAYINDKNNRVAFTNPGTFDAASLAASQLGTRFLIQRT